MRTALRRGVAKPDLPALLKLRGGATAAGPKPAIHAVFEGMEDEGAKRSAESSKKLLMKGIVAGCCVGLGGTLCAGIGGKTVLTLTNIGLLAALLALALARAEAAAEARRVWK